MAYILVIKDVVNEKKIKATQHRTLLELIKVNDFQSIRELIGFTFNENDYLNALYHTDYKRMSFDTLWRVMVLIEYNYQFNFDINQLSNDP